MKIVHTYLEFEQLSTLARDFGLEIDADWQLLSGGSNNTNYRIESGGVQYILTICDGKDARDVGIFVKVLDYLENNGFHSSKCFRTSSGAPYSFYENKTVVLKSYIPGIVPEYLSILQAFNLGVQIGNLHSLPPPDFLPETIEYDLEYYDSLKVWIKKSHVFIGWLGQMKHYIIQHLPPNLPKCMIHGDIFCDNLVMQGDDPVILDFEEVCYYERVFDLGMAIIGACRTEGKVDLLLVKNLIRGYQSMIRQTDSEKKAIRLFAIYSAVGTAYWRFKQFNVIVPDDRYKSHYLEMCRLTEELLKLTDDDFIC